MKIFTHTYDHCITNVYTIQFLLAEKTLTPHPLRPCSGFAPVMAAHPGGGPKPGKGLHLAFQRVICEQRPQRLFAGAWGQKIVPLLNLRIFSFYPIYPHFKNLPSRFSHSRFLIDCISIVLPLIAVESVGFAPPPLSQEKAGVESPLSPSSDTTMHPKDRTDTTDPQIVDKNEKYLEMNASGGGGGVCILSVSLFATVWYIPPE